MAKFIAFVKKVKGGQKFNFGVLLYFRAILPPPLTLPPPKPSFSLGGWEVVGEGEGGDIGLFSP